MRTDSGPFIAHFQQPRLRLLRNRESQSEGAMVETNVKIRHPSFSQSIPFPPSFRTRSCSFLDPFTDEELGRFILPTWIPHTLYFPLQHKFTPKHHNPSQTCHTRYKAKQISKRNKSPILSLSKDYDTPQPGPILAANLTPNSAQRHPCICHPTHHLPFHWVSILIQFNSISSPPTHSSNLYPSPSPVDKKKAKRRTGNAVRGGEVECEKEERKSIVRRAVNDFMRVQV